MADKEKIPFIGTDDYWSELSNIANNVVSDIADLLKYNGNEPTMDEGLNIDYDDFYSLIWVDEENEPCVFDKSEGTILVREMRVQDILDLAEYLNSKIGE